jgi:ATP-dependent exoDNAse (exonuclease V) beta subunit
MTLKVYRSSAGSGKTFTLALEYLSLAISSPNAFRQILAVTFTNKAANEMKFRIIRFLQILADNQHPEKSLRNLLLNRMMADGHGSAPEVQQKASKVFHHILHNYSDFSVSTIDAFLYRIVLTFSRDVALPTQFELILQSDEIVNRLLDRLYEYIGTDTQLTDHLITFLLENMDEQNSHNIDRIIKGFCTELLNERSVTHAAQLSTIDFQEFKSMRLSLRDEYQKQLAQLQKYAKNAVDLLKRYNLGPEALKGGKNGPGGLIVKLMGNNDFESFFEKKTVLNAIRDKDSVFSKNSRSGLPDNFAEAMEDLFHKIGQWYDAHFTRMVMLKMIYPGLSTLALTSRLYLETEKMIRDELIVHISEFNKRVAGLLSQSGVPYIYERLGERYHQFLLDEFQDTSILQWSNFLPLIENGLSSGYNSLIVGDAKQAIYRWRNGEVELFVRLPEVFSANHLLQLTHYASTLKHHFKLFNLKSNYRSGAHIVDFNNQFFQFVSEKLPEKYKHIYDDCQQNSTDEANYGYVSVSFMSGSQELKPEEEAINRLVDTLRKLFDDGYAPGDVAVLCRVNKQCRVIARRLTSEGIRIVSSESLQLNSSPSVNAVVSALRLIAEGTDKLYSVELQSALAAHSNRPDNLVKALQPGEAFLGQLPSLASIQEMTSNTSLYDLTEALIGAMGLHKPYDAFLEAFLDRVLAFQTVEGEGLLAFLRHWEDVLKQTTIVLPNDRTAVSILTVHKAKGLEFPVVILPFAELSSNSTNNKRIWVDLGPDLFPPLRSALLRPSKRMLLTPFKDTYLEEQEKEQLDTINLTYVAFTRPEERLYIFFSRRGGNANHTVTELMIGFLKQLGQWADDQHEYAFGTLKPPKYRNKVEQQTNLVAETMPSGKILALKKPNSIPILRATAFGNRVHEVLSAIGYASDVEPVLKQQMELGNLTWEEAHQIKTIVDALLKKSELRPFFEPPAHILNEASFTDGQGRMFRVDRYVELEDQRVIIEYKTGSPDKLHHEQLQQYKHYVGKIEGANILGMLVYLSDKPQIIKL